MKLELRNSFKMDKCYAVAPSTIRGSDVWIVAAEKTDDCVVFDADGNYIETVWKGPSGTMSLVPLANLNGGFLASRLFYSPNDSKEARIDACLPGKDGWEFFTLAFLPFVHRFDVLEKDGVRYVVGATIKDQHDYKDDWTHPGKVFAAVLPDNTEDWIRKGGKLEFKAIATGLTHNHGYTRWNGNGVVSSDEGVFEVILPSKGGEFQVRQLCSDAISDIYFADFDGDGKDEMLAILPFHGNRVAIYHENGDRYEKVYEYEKELEFSHAIWAGKFGSKAVGLVGNRKGGRDITAFTFDNCGYRAETILEERGSANFAVRGNQLVATNREIDEIDFYEVVL